MKSAAELFPLLLVTLALVALAYCGLGAALFLRKRRHNAGFTCASVQSGSGTVHGCVCRDREAGCCSESKASQHGADTVRRIS